MAVHQVRLATSSKDGHECRADWACGLTVDYLGNDRRDGMASGREAKARPGRKIR